MRLFLVEKMDAYGKHSAMYLVQSTTEPAALQKVNLSPDDVEEMNKPYQKEPYLRYKVTLEEISFNDEGFYVLDWNF